MENVFEEIRTIHKDFSVSDSRAYARVVCPQCGPVQAGKIARFNGSRDHDTEWLRCTQCGLGMVRNGEEVSPPGLPLSVPAGLPDAELGVWQEARSCLSVSAYMAAVTLCRKLLFHAAVDSQLPAKDPTGHAPSFARCVSHLEQRGVITASMRPWVERIKDVGNEANHELSVITREQAMDVAEFTLQFLKIAYEMPAMMIASNPDPEERSGG